MVTFAGLIAADIGKPVVKLDGLIAADIGKPVVKFAGLIAADNTELAVTSLLTCKRACGYIIPGLWLRTSQRSLLCC